MTASRLTEPRSRVWAKHALVILLVVGFLILAGFLGAAFIPRWWAHRIGDQVNGGIATGIIIGLFYGFVFTALPLLVLFWTFGKKRSLKAWVIGFIGAIVLALPNLFTLGIVLGTGNAAHAGERTLDVDGPGFRGASLGGAIAAVLLVGLWEYIRISGRLHRRKLHRLEQRLRERDRPAPVEPTPPPSPPAPPPSEGQS